MVKLNFTFLVFVMGCCLVSYQALAKYVKCPSPNYLFQCSTGEVCTSNRNYKCPSSNYSSQTTTSSPAATTTTSSSSNVKRSSPSRTTTTTRRTAPDSGASSAGDNTDLQSKCYDRNDPACSKTSQLDAIAQQKAQCESQPNMTFFCSDEGEEMSCSCVSELRQNSEDSPKASNDANSINSEQCILQFNQMVGQCQKEADSAMTSCNDNNEEMQAAENAAKAIGAGSAVSIHVACSKIGQLSKLANGAFTGWKSLCATNQGGCEDSCGEAKRILDSNCILEQPRAVLKAEYYSKISANINQCASYKEKIAQAAQHAAAALAQLKSSEQCSEDSASNFKSNAVDQCKANPNSPVCRDLQRCSEPAFAAQNPVCTCVGNPTSPSCLQASAQYGNGKLASGLTLPGVKGKANGDSLSGLPTGNGDQVPGQNPFGAMGQSTDGQSVGGRQGDASSAGKVGSNGAGGAAGGGGYGGGSGDDTGGIKVNSGTYGGSPTMGGSGYFSRTTAGSPSGYGAAGMGRQGQAKFDPRKYIMGHGGKGEFINTANGNIFKIVKMRYQDKQETLLPGNFIRKK